MQEKETAKALVAQLRPFIQRDGGDMRFIEYAEGILTLELLGACIGCGSAEDHQSVVREILLQEVPFLTEVKFL